MHKTCVSKQPSKKIQYECSCREKTCSCDTVIEFDTEPKATPYCCGVPMKQKKVNHMGE